MVAQECFEEALIDGTREVFETMMFMTVEECNECYDALEGQALLGSITFEGPVEGCLGICCGETAAKTIAQNMLGDARDDELTSEGIADAIGEVANMVMGAIKSRIADSVGDVTVSIPTVISGSELHNSLGDESEEISRVVSIDDEMAILTLMYREAK